MELGECEERNRRRFFVFFPEKTVVVGTDSYAEEKICSLDGETYLEWVHNKSRSPFPVLVCTLHSFCGFTNKFGSRFDRGR